MITINGSWTPERGGARSVRNVRELCDYINEVGFLPYFKSCVDGFSAEEAADVLPDMWWSDDPEYDPWLWRSYIASGGDIAYGKFFRGRAGFVSREWFPIFASYRRDGYDFDSACDDGLVNHRQRLIMDALGGDTMFSSDLKRKAGFVKNGEKGFDGTMQLLQMQSYIVVRGFRQRTNKRGEPYGWALSVVSSAESLYGAEHISSGYKYEREEAFGLLFERVRRFCPNASDQQIDKMLRL